MNALSRIPLLGLLSLVASLAHAQAVSTEDFTGAATTNSWYYFNGACLTAGTGASNGMNGTVAGLIPGCKNIVTSYYDVTHNGTTDNVLNGGYSDTKTTSHTSAWSDTIGQGALRFTNGSYDGSNGGKNENGAIVSSTPFDAGAGVQITFKTVTYRGNGSGSTGDGADGMSFYLIDAVNFQPIGGSLTKPWNGIGSYGGSLGYTCSNSNAPYDGLNGGYLGLGIDEYGNFLNGTNLTATSSSGGPVGTASGDNTASGYGFMAQRIGLRGAGSVSWAYLAATYPSYYPLTTLNTAALQQAAVKKTCQTGQVWNYSSSASSPASVSNPSPALYDYAAIPDAFSVLPAKTIAGEWASAVYDRVQATPIFYKLTITQDGLLSLAYAINGSSAYTSIINNRSISATNALPSLPAKLYFAFAGSTGGSANIHEIMCFKAAPATTSSTSAAVSQQLATKVQTSTQAYFSYYNPNDWTGRLTAYGLVDTAGVLTSNSLANWDAQCNLSNSTTCPTVGNAPAATAVTSYTAREILTWNASTADASTNAGTAAVPFVWASLTSSQQAQIGAGDANTTVSQARVSYLRGSQTNEIDSTGSGLFRARDGILADIIDSSPAWVGPPSSPYAQTWKDIYLPGYLTSFPENTGQAYQTFRTLEQGRLNVVYVGANDGMMHAFEAGSQTSLGALVDNTTTPNDGAEILAYMPGYVQNIIHQYSSTANTEAALAPLDLSNSQYSHAFFVDGPPGTGDLYYNGNWHTWLMSGLGLGGQGIFALDITNPNSAVNNSAAPAFSTGAGSPNTSVAMGEWSSKSITCVNVSNCGNNLGNVSGQPLFRKLHNGSWGVIFGNGFGSTSGDAGIFIMMVDPSSGAKTFYYFSTATGSTSSPNGISYVTAADFDGDHITDYVYAGDLQGNVWRFDLTGCAPSGTTASTCPSWARAAWAVTPGPLFKTSTGQPITTAITLASAEVSGTNPSVILTFGTGQRTQFTTTTATSYATGTQSIYGVWDYNFTTWNAHSAFPNQSLVVASSASTDQTGLRTAAGTLSPSNLQAQVYSAGTSGSIIATITNISWRSCTGTTTTCTGTQFGWYVNLPSTNEQIVSSPSSDQQAIVVNSTVPANNAVLSCTSNSDTGYSYIFNPLTGGTFTNTNGTAISAFVNNFSQSNMVGSQTNSTGGLSVVNTAEGTSYIVGQSITPASAGSSPAVLFQQQLPPNVVINKKTWVQLR